jgi:hypothetical protein
MKTMKNLFLALALVAYIGTVSANTLVSSENNICMMDEKGKKDKKKKCNKTAEGKSCAGQKTAAEAKSCAKTSESAAKSCCASKKAEGAQTKEEVK